MTPQEAHKDSYGILERQSNHQFMAATSAQPTYARLLPTRLQAPGKPRHASPGRRCPLHPAWHSTFGLGAVVTCTGRGSCNKRDFRPKVECRGAAARSLVQGVAYENGILVGSGSALILVSVVAVG